MPYVPMYMSTHAELFALLQDVSFKGNQVIVGQISDVSFRIIATQVLIYRIQRFSPILIIPAFKDNATILIYEIIYEKNLKKQYNFKTYKLPTGTVY